MLEHLDQPVAQAFRVLPGQARHVPHVRTGERDDQAVVVHELAGDAGLRHTEIDLRDAGRPDELAVPVGTAPVRLAPASHVPRRRRVLAVVLGLRAEPVVHAFGGVALLAWRPAVGLEPSVDQRRVRVDLGALAPVHGRFRRHVVHIGVFRDSGAVHVRPPCDLRPGHSLTVQSPDILRFGIGIAIVLSFPSAAGCSRRICFWAASREYTGTAGWCLFSSGRSYGAVSAGNQQPMLRKNSAEIA